MTGPSDVKTMNYKMWRCVLRPFVLLLEPFQAGRDGGLYKFGSKIKTATTSRQAVDGVHASDSR